MKIDLAGFSGSNQAIDAKLLANNVGVMVLDCEPGFGALRPMKVRATVATVPASPQRLSIWRMGRDVVSSANYWLSSPNAVNWALEFGSPDSTERTFYTGDGTPRWTNNVLGLGGGPPYPQAYRELAVPAPSGAATVALNTDGTGTPNARFYVSTFVNDLGWESAPSAVSASLVAKPGAIVDITGLPAAPAGAYGITLRRIYRTQPEQGSSEADFFFLREIAVGTTSTQDDARVLGDLIPTYAGVQGSSWQVPPADGFGITAMWNSMYSLLSGKFVMICEPGAPYAYPLRYRKKLRDTAVAQATFQQNLVVLTTGRPVVFQGQDPLGLQDYPLPQAYACHSARSVVSFEHGVVWASDEGLAFTGQETFITFGLLTPDQWRAMNPTTMVAGRWGRFYVCSFNDGNGARAFMLDPLRPGDGLWYLSTGFDACYYDPLQNKLFVLEGANVREFAAGPGLLAGSYTSKEFEQERPRNYAHARLIASAYPQTMTITSRIRLPDNSLSTSVEARTVSNARAFKLKQGLAESVQIKLDVTAYTQAARLATHIDDMKG